MTRTSRNLRTRRAAAPLAVLAGLAIAGMARSALSFVSPSMASRRGLLLAGVAGGLLPSLQAAEPAYAASAPETLELSGMPGKRASLNGFWSVEPGKSINERAVYKRDGEDTYLMFNDCGSFQLSTKATGDCSGFAAETKGKWNVDGVEVTTVRLRPAKKDKSGGLVSEVASTGPIKLPTVGLTGRESDDELLFGKDKENVNVIDFVKAKSGVSAGANNPFLESQMQLDEKEAAVADSLEARLAGKRVR